MKKIVYCYLVILLLLSNFLLAQDTLQTSELQRGDLKLIVTGFDNNKGNVKIILFNSKESYSDKKDKKSGYKYVITNIHKNKSEYIFKKIPFGEYAIKLYHDENENNKIETNFLGIPKEGYGFSNNVMGKFGPPGFDKAKFIFNSDSLNIGIKIR